MKALFVRLLLVFLFVLLVLQAISIPGAQAQTLNVLYSFKNGPDGATPEAAGLFRDKQGNLYGTNCCGGSAGWGTVFKLDTSGKETVLYSFALGAVYPAAGLVMDKANNLFGTTLFFGGESGYGSVFRLDPSGKIVVLHQFTGQPDGAHPSSRLLIDRFGNLYGTTMGGGSANSGTVFKIDSAGHETILHSFTGPDGQLPFHGKLIMDNAGNLYGTTLTGGLSNQGTVFKLDSAGQLTLLYSFAGPDGGSPTGLVRDKKGNLYGTTATGGSFGFGTVFRLDTAGKQTVLYNFAGSTDGAFPRAGLVMDKKGNLYGSTYNGGSAQVGVLFKLDASGKETVLHDFADVPDGAYPDGDLIIDNSGKLYGTTQNGGDQGFGAVFELLPEKRPH
jgi:uncharacterized repeat protein (TIGR03803 family)